MIHSLPLFHRIAGAPVIVLGEGEAGEAKRRLVERAGGVIVGKDDPQARLAFVALADPDAAAASLKARGLLVNVADRPDLCDFTVPSLLERGPVLVAVGTGGVSAGLAKALRLRLEGLLPSSLGGLAQALGTAKARLRQRFPDSGARRRAIDTALAEGGTLDPLDPASTDRFSGWLDEGESPPEAVYEIQLRSSDPDDLTLREARLLGTADTLLIGEAVPDRVLARSRADAVRRPLSEAREGAVIGITVILRAP